MSITRTVQILRQGVLRLEIAQGTGTIPKTGRAIDLWGSKKSGEGNPEPIVAGRADGANLTNSGFTREGLCRPLGVLSFPKR